MRSVRSTITAIKRIRKKHRIPVISTEENSAGIWKKISIKKEQWKNGQIYTILQTIRKNEKVFLVNAGFYTLETYEQAVICIVREYEGEKLIGLFNFSEFGKMAWINEDDGMYRDLITGKEMKASGVMIPGNGFFWLKKEK